MTKSINDQRDNASDRFLSLARAVRKLHSEWVRISYAFAAVGRRISVEPTCDLNRNGARYISMGEDTILADRVWLNIVEDHDGPQAPKLVLGDRCKIGRRSVISARNYIELEDDVMLAPGVFIVDHNHEFSDPDRPIHSQGVTEGGTVVIGRNSWLGYGSVICCAKGDLTIGRNSVVGANSVVTRSFPDYSVIAGNPAKLIRSYDPELGLWVRANSEVPIGSR